MTQILGYLCKPEHFKISIYWNVLLYINKNILFIRYADHVTIGDEILVKENEILIPSTVVQIASMQLQGKKSMDFLAHLTFNLFHGNNIF